MAEKRVDAGIMFQTLLRLANREDVCVGFKPLPISDGRIKGDRIAIRGGLEIDAINYNLAHELSHHFLHFDKGNIMDTDKNAEYEEQADRAAKMLLCAIEVSHSSKEGGAAHA